jgi:hypothetical protein
MTRLTITLAALTMTGGLAAFPTAADAQQGGRLEVTVYGSDPCPRSTESQVVVCSHRPEAERYRLPKSQNPQGTRQQRESWANRAQALTTVGNSGAQSCTNVGPAGFTGCVVQSINQAKQERKEQTQQDTPPEQ